MGPRMRVPPNHKFAAVFLSRCGDGLPEHEDLGAVQVGRELAVDWAQWSGWLGSITMDELKGDGLLFLAARPSRDLEGDQENEDLRKKVNYVLSGLLVLGVPSFMRGVIISGARLLDRLHMRQYTAVTDLQQTAGVAEFRVDVAAMRRALHVADRLEDIQNAAGQRWARLGRAVSTLLKANKESNQRGDRLHQFVRALEGLILPRIMRSADDFAHRGQTFAVARADTAALLREVFTLRNQVEHLHLPTDILAGSREERFESVNRRTRQMDALARFAIVRVLETPDLFANVFDSDDHIAAFWDMPDGDRVARWGGRLEIVPIA
jgi:hypothetical protein